MCILSSSDPESFVFAPPSPTSQISQNAPREDIGQWMKEGWVRWPGRKSILQRLGIHDYYAIGWDRSQKSPNKLVLFTWDYLFLLILSLIRISKNQGMIARVRKDIKIVSNTLVKVLCGKHYFKQFMYINSVNPHIDQ